MQLTAAVRFDVAPFLLFLYETLFLQLVFANAVNNGVVLVSNKILGYFVRA
jgi:hypothetical protein